MTDTPATSQIQDCQICGAPATEPLTFGSQYKSSTVYLCAKHFQNCRTIYNTYLLDKQPLGILKAPELQGDEGYLIEQVLD